MKPDLFIYCHSFPFGESEVFLANELQFISNQFNKIFLIPAYPVEMRRKVPENITVIPYNPHVFKKTIFSRLRLLSRYLYISLLIDGRLKKPGRDKQTLLDAIKRIDFIEGNLKGYKYAINYSFWTDEWALALAILKQRGEIKYAVSRVHGYDLYEERSKGGYIPFRQFVLEKLNRIYTVSHAGYEYLVKKYPRFSDKYFIFSLGVKDNGMAPLPSDRNIEVVSCSNVIPLKRVQRIAEVLIASKLSLNWTHFGDGKDLAAIKELMKDHPNISFVPRGHVPNDELMAFYKNNPVHVFIHMSESEGGIPVSIQEAISFGIPVLACNAGGVNEVVNHETGVLLPADSDIKDAVKGLQLIINDFSISNEKRCHIRSVWKENFDAEVKYTNFAKHLIDE